MRVAAAGSVGVRVEVRTATGVVLTNTNGALVVQSVGDDGDTAGGRCTSGCRVTEVDGLPTGTAAADRGCGWRAADRGFEASRGGTTVVGGQVAAADGGARTRTGTEAVGVAWSETTALQDLNLEGSGCTGCVVHVLLPLDLVNGSTAGQSAGGSEGVLVPWHVVVGTVVSVVVAVGAAVTVSVVDVTVATCSGVHTNGRVNGDRVNTVFIEEPVGLNHGDEEDFRAVDLNEEGPHVGLFCTCFHDHGRRDFHEKFAGFDVSDLKVFLRLEEFFTEHRLAREECVASWHAQSFAETEVLSCLWNNGNLSEDEVLLDLVALDGVVKVETFCERVADDVATHVHAVRAWSSDERLGSRSGLVKGHEHGVDTGDHRVNKLVCLNRDAVGDFRGEVGREGVLRHAPALWVGLNVQVNVFPSSIGRHVVNRFTGHHLRNGAVLIEEGLGLGVSHPLKFKGRVIFVFCFGKLFGEREVILCSSRVCFHRLHGCCCFVVVNVAAHWHEHHQCAQQQCNPDTAEDGLLLVILVSQHMSFTPYGLYAVHPTSYTIYIDWGA